MNSQNIFERPILFFSEYCIHSKNFLNLLIKNPDMYKNFIRINIDVDNNTKKRPDIFYKVQKMLNYKIIEIPTIIIENAEYVLTGEKAFEWLEHITKKEETLEGFNPIEMGSFSDSYSIYGSSDLNNAKEQSFKFVKKSDEKINTPQETQPINKDEFSIKQKEREQFDNTLSQSNPLSQRNVGNNNNGNGNGQKQQDFDSKLQEMMLERQRQ